MMFNWHDVMEILRINILLYRKMHVYLHLAITGYSAYCYA